MKRMISVLTLALCLVSAAASAAEYYVDSLSGQDSNNGTAAEQAWKTLDKVNATTLGPGDRVLLKKGCTFEGYLDLKANGSAQQPVVVDAYGSGELPVVDVTGAKQGILIANSSFLEVNNLEITSQGKGIVTAIDISSSNTACEHIYLNKLYIHDIYAKTRESVEHLVSKDRTKEGFQFSACPGQGIVVLSKEPLKDLRIENCRLERIAQTGISIHGRKSGTIALTDIQVLNNTLKEIGGPGIQPSRVAHMVVRGNIVDQSGCATDIRMRGRGSGIWPWGSDDVLIEKNQFLHARGSGDSCGAHIDFNCSNVTVQYNLSADNEGGFVEILGNDKNCCYRYNISVNDGARVKGRNAMMDGKTLWLSSFTGGAKRCGPYNAYIYNNTIYVKESIRSAFVITRTTEGALIANNIFCVLGKTKGAGDDQDLQKVPATVHVKNVDWRNNLYCKADILPSQMPTQNGEVLHDTNPIIGDPQFKNAGGLSAEDYIPGAVQLLKDKGIEIEALPGDKIGLKQGLKVTEDFFGNPIEGLPDIGAIEIQSKE